MIFKPMAVDGTFGAHQTSPNAYPSIFQLQNTGIKHKSDSFLKGKTWQDMAKTNFHRIPSTSE